MARYAFLHDSFTHYSTPVYPGKRHERLLEVSISTGVFGILTMRHSAVSSACAWHGLVP
jgi:hypothetical protein